MAEVAMPMARYKGPDGREEIVQLPGTALHGGNVRYDAAVHKGHLHCVCCDIQVSFDPGSETVNGGLRGPSPHFQRYPKQKHDDDCLMGLRIDEGRPAKDYDMSLGYRIHLNTRSYSELFNNASYPYERDEDHKLKMRYPALDTMEPFSVKTIEDVLRLMKRGDFERLQKSIVIQKGSRPLRWEEFFVRYARRGGDHRFVELAESLHRGETRPALVEIFSERSVRPHAPFGHTPHGTSKRIFLGRDERGRDEYIIPCVWLDNKRDSYVREALYLPGRYLVLGYPRLRTEYNDRSVIHFLNISVSDRRQIVAADIEAVARAAMLRRAPA